MTSPRERRNLLRELTQEAVDEGSYGEPVPDTTTPTPTLRDQMGHALRKAFEHHIVAEWICCDPPQKGHKLCKRGHTALVMVRSLLDEDSTSHTQTSPIIDALLPLFEAEIAKVETERDDYARGAAAEAAERDHEKERADRAEAAVQRVRKLATDAQKAADRSHSRMLGGRPFPAQVPASDVLAALDGEQSEEHNLPVDTWTVSVEVPLRLPVEMRHDLFTAVANAVGGWEPDDRDGWDAEVSGNPTAESLRAWESLAAVRRVEALLEPAPTGSAFAINRGGVGETRVQAVVPRDAIRAALDQPEETP